MKEIIKTNKLTNEELMGISAEEPVAEHMDKRMTRKVVVGSDMISRVWYTVYSGELTLVHTSDLKLAKERYNATVAKNNPVVVE